MNHSDVHFNTQTRSQLTKEASALKSRLRSLMQGRLVPTPKAAALSRRIDDIEDRIRAIDTEAANRLALARAPVDDVLEVIAIPLLADVINDVVAGVDATLRRNGCEETVFGIYTRQIRQAALAMVDTLALGQEHLPDLLAVDDTLVDAVRKKLMSFIRQRLNISK